MKRQRVTISFPQSYITTYVPADCEREVHGVAHIRGEIESGVDQLIQRFNRQVQDLEAEVTFANGDTIKVPLGINVWGSCDIKVTEQSIKIAAGEAIPIRFGSILHNCLYKISGGSCASSNASVTLQALGLIQDDAPLRGAAITDKGKHVLVQLNELGPSDNKRGRILVANRLLRLLNSTAVIGSEDVVWNYLHEIGFIEIETDPTFSIKVCTLNNKAFQWLEERAYKMYQYKLPDNFPVWHLVHFMTKEQLAGPLASTDPFIRKAAVARMNELGGEVPERTQEEMQKEEEEKQKVVAKLFHDLISNTS